MGSHSPHPNSLSPQIKQTSTAFHWPIPDSPSRLKPINSQNMNELSIKEILERYNDDPELMKYILTAKAEEDKRKAAKDTLKAEEARIQLRQMDLDFAREQTKASARYERHSIHPGHHYAPHPPQPPPPPPQTISTPHGPPQGPYYGLAPVQQQVLARFHYPGQPSHPPPSSPSVPYPHSAHPLCTSTNTTDRVQQLRQTSPISPNTNNNNNNNNNSNNNNEESNYKKRNRSSMTSPNEQLNDSSQPQQQQDKLSHNKVMEALKAKIQRGNNGPPSPLATTPMNQQENQNKKRKPTLPRPVVVHATTISSPSPSPRSAKPVLPPIDTNLGRIDTIKLEGNDSTTSSSTISSSSDSSHKSNLGDKNLKSTNTTTTTTTTTTTNVAVASPSDHILLNTRRARSLSPSASSLVKKS